MIDYTGYFFSFFLPLLYVLTEKMQAFICYVCTYVSISVDKKGRLVNSSEELQDILSNIETFYKTNLCCVCKNNPQAAEHKIELIPVPVPQDSTGCEVCMGLAKFRAVAESGGLIEPLDLLVSHQMGVSQTPPSAK